MADAGLCDPDGGCRAARLFGAATMWGEPGFHPTRACAQRIAIDRTIAAVGGRLEEAVIATAWTEGRAMTLAQPIANALDATAYAPHAPCNRLAL